MTLTDSFCGDCSPEDYLGIVRRCKAKGERVPAPMTLEQLQALYDAFPRDALPLMPPRAERERLGLRIVEDTRAMPVKFRRDFVATLATDPDFAAAVRRIAAKAAGGAA